MLQDYEDWQAETPAIILDIPIVQAKEHHTDEELRSLTLEALSVAYPSTTWATAYTDGSAEAAAKMADPSGSLWLQGSSQQITELKQTHKQYTDTELQANTKNTQTKNCEQTQTIHRHRIVNKHTNNTLTQNCKQKHKQNTDTEL